MFRVFERNSVGSARLSRRWIERVRGGGYESIIIMIIIIITTIIKNHVIC